MKNKIKIKYSKILDSDRIVSGITLRNEEFCPPIGFSISKADYFTEEEIEENRQILASELGLMKNQLVFQKQIHSDIVRTIDENHQILESDGMVTNKKNLCLVVSLADCCGVMMFDPNKNVIASVHSGWKGTSKNITGKAIQKMVEEFSINPSDLRVWLTPCAGKEDYEVGSDVAELFPGFVEPNEKGKYLLDLKSAILNQLLDRGVIESNIEISPESTISDKNYHSYRRDKRMSGRMAAFIMIK